MNFLVGYVLEPIINICNNRVCKDQIFQRQYNWIGCLSKHLVRRQFSQGVIWLLAHQDVLGACRLYSHIFQNFAIIPFEQEPAQPRFTSLPSARRMMSFPLTVYLSTCGLISTLVLP